jgi:hypothetical protein
MTMATKLINAFEPLEINDAFMTEPNKEVKKRVLNWLIEENFSPKEMTDPNAYFNYNITVAGKRARDEKG